MYIFIYITIAIVSKTNYTKNIIIVSLDENSSFMVIYYMCMHIHMHIHTYTYVHVCIYRAYVLSAFDVFALK